MPKKAANEDDAQRLAEGLSKDREDARAGRARKGALRAEPGGNAGRALADERNVSPLARLLGALRAEKIRFQVIGMTAANLQGVPGSTIDVDLWLDLSPREYMRAINLAIASGAQFVRNTVVELADGTLVNFIYEVTGLPAFGVVYRKARKISWLGSQVPVMSLELIEKSKRAIGRSKDLTHLELIRQTRRVKRKAGK
jgi:hypothetical protein